VVLILVYDRVCVYAVDEEIDCCVLMFLWMTRVVIVYDQICRCGFSKYCDGLAQSIARQRPSEHVPTHAPRKNTVEMFSLCQRTDRCYATRPRSCHTTVGTTADT
jgi:hypothetical protein